ncbi:MULTISPECIES: DUF6615 family protein [Bacillus]|uniref:DUF6615 family protein n=1 Tax=Bacillus sp. 196mf TaxID=1761754 RepID=UPI0009422CEE|nr:hypothetical protein ATL10_100181 [Bacillus sp. 196mf]
MNLCHLSIRETNKLYATMKIAQELGIKIQEETLTELMLIDLKFHIEKMGLNTIIKHCNKSEEFELGTDFLWFVGSNKKKSWVAFRIQAKKLRENQKYFLKHNYKNATGSGSITRQVDKLIENSEKNNLGDTRSIRAIPIYCFYNCLNDETLSKVTYLNQFPHIPLNKKALSFTYTCAYHVQSLLNQPHSKKRGTTKNTFSFNELKGIPIYTLFCSNDCNKSLARSLYDTYHHYHSTFFKSRNNGWDFFFKDSTYNFTKLPSYVESLINNTKDTLEEYDRKNLPSYIMVTYED